MTGTTTGQLSLATCTDSDDTEAFLTVSLTTDLQTLVDLFHNSTGHDHSGSGKGAPIGAAGIASGVTLTTPTVSGLLTMTTAASQIKPGATSFAIRNNANGADNLIITDAGDAGFRGALATGGVANLTTDGLTVKGKSGGVAKSIAWNEAGAGLSSILNNTVGGAPSSCVLRFDVANGSAAGTTTALTLDGNGDVITGRRLKVSNLPAFAASDKYLIVDASGNVHVSALGPAS